jgi:hypothetical protein
MISQDHSGLGHKRWSILSRNAVFDILLVSAQGEEDDLFSWV